MAHNLEGKYTVDENTGCWEWQRHKNEDGYGTVRLNGKMWKAHRAAYALFVGDIAADMRVCHRCDNPGCVNPEHLFLGTQLDNIQDMLTKGRGNKPNGTRVNTAKLTEEIVLKIRELYATGEYSQAKLAKMFSVAQPQVCRLINRTSWKHI